MSLLSDLVHLDDEVDVLEAQLKETKHRREMVRIILFDVMVGSGIEAFEEVVGEKTCRVSPKVDIMASVPEDSGKTFTDFCATRVEIPETDCSPKVVLLQLLAKVTFNAKTLSSWVKKEFLNDREVPHLSVYFKPGIQLTRKNPKQPKEPK